MSASRSSRLRLDHLLLDPGRLDLGVMSSDTDRSGGSA
jgi:hypothetical protein